MRESRRGTGVWRRVALVLGAWRGAHASTEAPFGLREGLLEQRSAALQAAGESLTIMCIGESGVGKTSLLSNIFARQMGAALNADPRPGRRGPIERPTQDVTETFHRFTLEGLPFRVRLIDTPGYGETSNLKRAFRSISRHLDARFEAALRREYAPERRRMGPPELSHEATGGVDAILYFFAPHRCKGADIEYLRMVQNRASIIPILAKADTMTSNELDEFRKLVIDKLKAARVRTFCEPFAIISSPLERAPSSRFPALVAAAQAAADEEKPEILEMENDGDEAEDAPLDDGEPAVAVPELRPSVVNGTYRASETHRGGAATTQERVQFLNGRVKRDAPGTAAKVTPDRTRWVPSKGRVYRWGTAEPENPSHSDLSKLRSFLLYERLADLHAAKVGCYERYRAQCLGFQRTVAQLLVPGLVLASAILSRLDLSAAQARVDTFLPLFAPFTRLIAIAGRSVNKASAPLVRFLDVRTWGSASNICEEPMALPAPPARKRRSAPPAPVEELASQPLKRAEASTAAPPRDRFFFDGSREDEDDWDGPDVEAMQRAQLREQGARGSSDSRDGARDRGRDADGTNGAPGS